MFVIWTTWPVCKVNNINFNYVVNNIIDTMEGKATESSNAITTAFKLRRRHRRPKNMTNVGHTFFLVRY